MRLASLLLLVGLPGWVARRCYQPGPEVRRWRHGAEGEQRTARLLRPLARRGWTVLHDLAIPGTRANADHLVLLPDGRGAVMVDSKHLNRTGQVTVRGGTLHCGNRTYPDMLSTARGLAEKAGAALGVPAAALVVVHGARVPNGRIRAQGVTIVSPSRLRGELTSIPCTPDRDRAELLADRARRHLPPHT
ncbi:NERD domain-containing protein (plasmid) [Streptomyces sp. 891-h]|nr:NERD domain-containing protein [Streptomyces sp. 891-h]